MGQLLQGADRLQVKSAYLQWQAALATDPVPALFFDAVLSEDHERAADISEYAVEQGYAVVDNVRPLPSKLTLEVFVSNSPIISQDGQVLPLTILIDPVGQAVLKLRVGNLAPINDPLSLLGPTSVTASTLQFTGDIDYVGTTFATLVGLRDSATLLTITTPKAFYENMIIEKISMHRDASTGTSGKFSLEFREIRIVSSKVVAAPNPSILTSTPETSQGAKSTANTPKVIKTNFELYLESQGRADPNKVASNTVPQ